MRRTVRVDVLGSFLSHVCALSNSIRAPMKQKKTTDRPAGEKKKPGKSAQRDKSGLELRKKKEHNNA